jgi:DNA-binding transcriptional regulator LsrR (DeoR family)
MADTSRVDEDGERERCRVAADLYYNGEFTQEYIAAYLGISRPWVSRLIKRARELGVVTISVEPSTQRQLGLERRLAQVLQISRCLIASSTTLEDTARMAAAHLAESLRDGDVLGLAWGKTLAAIVNAFEPAQQPLGLRCVALIGGASVARPEIDSNRLVLETARKLGAAANVLNAPAFVENAHVRQLLLNERGIRATLALAERTTVALMCVGGLTDSTIRELGTLSAGEFSELQSRRAVGDVCQWFIDEQGRPIDSGPSRRMISADLTRIRERARERIAVTIGEGRAKAIVAGARGRWFTTLVTNLPTARAVLDYAGARPADLATRSAAGD